MKSAKKRAPRKSLRKSGWITLEGGFAARECEIIDLSDSGAKISIVDPSGLSSTLRLGFTRDGRAGRPCQVVWRRGNTAGLRFTS
jgi:hypothetical protein